MGVGIVIGHTELFIDQLFISENQVCLHFDLPLLFCKFFQPYTVQAVSDATNSCILCFQRYARAGILPCSVSCFVVFHCSHSSDRMVSCLGHRVGWRMTTPNPLLHISRVGCMLKTRSICFCCCSQPVFSLIGQALRLLRDSDLLLR